VPCSAFYDFAERVTTKSKLERIKINYINKWKKRKELKQILYWLEWKKEHYRQQRSALIIHSCCSCCRARPRAGGKNSYIYERHNFSTVANIQSSPAFNKRHSLWVRLTHWIGTVAFLLLVITGFEILMVHPRLYWGEVGNDLTPAFLELPVSRNYKHEGYEKRIAFFTSKESPVSAVRTYDIFNENGWGRSLHFLSAWILVVTGLCYLIAAIFSGHLNRQLLPKKISYGSFSPDVKDHLVKKIPQPMAGSQYGLLQKTTYSVVLLLLFPVVILTGLTLSPTITAACPFLLKIFFGYQSARTIHFFASFLLVLFLLIHVVMVIRTGFKKNMLAMTIGNKKASDEKQ